MASAGDVVLGIFMPQQQAGQPETYSVVGRGASAFDEAVSRAASAKAKIKVPNIFVPLQMSRSCRPPLLDDAHRPSWPQRGPSRFLHGAPAACGRPYGWRASILQTKPTVTIGP